MEEQRHSQNWSNLQILLLFYYSDDVRSRIFSLADKPKVRRTVKGHETEIETKRGCNLFAPIDLQTLAFLLSLVGLLPNCNANTISRRFACLLCTAIAYDK